MSIYQITFRWIAIKGYVIVCITSTITTLLIASISEFRINDLIQCFLLIFYLPKVIRCEIGLFALHHTLILLFKKLLHTGNRFEALTALLSVLWD